MAVSLAHDPENCEQSDKIMRKIKYVERISASSETDRALIVSLVSHRSGPLQTFGFDEAWRMAPNASAEAR
jgi:hypothetical protein